MTITQTTGRDLAFAVAEYAAGLRAADLPATTVAATKANLFDTLACAAAGSSAAAVGEVVGLVTSWGGAPQATVLAYGQKLPAHHAAWANGTMAHARDYDDTHDGAVLHAGVSVVPAALAAAELRGNVSGGDLLAGVAAGLEIVCRLGVATTVGVIESGFIYTSLFGYFGATVAAGQVLGLDAGQMVNALGIAYSQVAGNHQVTRDAALTKRMQPGFAAKAALVSVELARRGVRGAQNTFQGVDGFFRVYLQNRYDPAVLADGLGRRYEMEQLSYKPYPCCRFNHTAIDAALAARLRWKIVPSEVRRAEVQVTRQGYEAVCTPVEVRKAPKTIVQAQFSIPYTVATALTDGSVTLADFTDEGIRRPEVLDLAARIDGVVGEDIERDWSRNISPARLRVEMRDGRVLEERIDHPKGHVKNPMTTAEFDAKLVDCLRFAARPLPADSAGRLRSLVDRLETLGDSGALARALVPAEQETRSQP